MDLEIKEDSYIWTGNLMQNPFPIKGSSCHDIKPQVRKLVRTIEGKLKLCFDRQHILGIDVWTS